VVEPGGDELHVEGEVPRERLAGRHRSWHRDPGTGSFAELPRRTPLKSFLAELPCRALLQSSLAELPCRAPLQSFLVELPCGAPLQSSLADLPSHSCPRVLNSFIRIQVFCAFRTLIRIWIPDPDFHDKKYKKFYRKPQKNPFSDCNIFLLRPT
jgi:hypothetical protein